MGDSHVNWVSNWLTGRKQRVTVEGGKSSWTTVHSGVPRGPVLGPLMYINDLDDTVGNSILKVADDAKMFGNVRSGQGSQILHEDLVWKSGKCYSTKIGVSVRLDLKRLLITILIRT